MSLTESKTENSNYVEKLKKVFPRIFGSSLTIWEECLFDSLPEELESFIELSADGAEKICDLIELFRMRMAPKYTQKELQELSDWLNQQGPQHATRLLCFLRFVNAALFSLARIKQDLLP